MKFESFVKKAVPYGVTINASDEGKWLYHEGMYVKIPEALGSIGRVTSEEIICENLLLHLNDSELRGKADLGNAYLKRPDGKNKDIIRVFIDSRGDTIEIRNDQFGMIEKKDMCVISIFEDDALFSKALLIGPATNLDEFEPVAVILEMEE